MRPDTLATRRRLYLLARVVVARHYRQPLTLTVVAGAVSSSPRQLQRAYAQFGETSFQEDLLARRMSVAAQLLAEQPAISVRDVARLVGYRQAPHFARAFRRRFGVPPARFRAQARAHRKHEAEALRQREAQPLPRSRPASAGAVGSASGIPLAPPAEAPLAAVGRVPPPCRSSAPGSTRSVRAKRKRISVPPPGAGSAPIRPPCWSATCRTIAKPSPEPGRPRASAPR